jgi:plasmid stabilization system protein ParE
MAQFDLTTKAVFDLLSIYEYLAEVDPANADSKIEAIKKDLVNIAENPILNLRDNRLPKKYRYWLIANGAYKAYFQRLAPDLILVYRIFPSRKPPLSPEEIVN